MSEEKSKGDHKPGEEIRDQNLFELKCLVKASDIQHCTQFEQGSKFFLAFTTKNAELILYLKKHKAHLPIIKRIPWFQAPYKNISALCFDNSGSMLLAASIDGTLYIIPALPLTDKTCTAGKSWNLDDITTFPTINSQTNYSRPTAIAWWYDNITSTNVAIIGTEYGEIIILNLHTGQKLEIVHIKGPVAAFNIWSEENTKNIILLVTSQIKQQWRLVLAGESYSCLSTENDKCSSLLGSNNTICDNSQNFSTTRARLQGLKQMSVEKLSLLRQKLVETKNQSLSESLRGKNSSQIMDSEKNVDSDLGGFNLKVLPADTYIISQKFKKDQHLQLYYQPEWNHIRICKTEDYSTPVSFHRIPFFCADILLTGQFFFTTDYSHQVIHIMSSHLSNTHVTGDNTLNSDCVIGKFSFKKSKETIIAVYRAPDLKEQTPVKFSDANENNLPKKLQDLELELPPLETCLIVTNQSVYKIVLRKSLLLVFARLILEKNEIDKAIRMASVFGLNIDHLLQYAGDIHLSNKDFIKAVSLYKLSKCKPLKTVLKFASAGNTSEFLSYLTQCLSSPAIVELPIATRIHFSNLCILAFIEVALRATPQQSRIIYKDFLYFLSTNNFYDELLAVNVAGQTCLWEILHYLSAQRGLHAQMLEIATKAACSFNSTNFQNIPYGLLICLSEVSLMQSMLLDPELARNHINFVLESLPNSQTFVLQRLLTLYDPTNAVLRPGLARCRARHRSISYSSQSSQCESMDLTDNFDASDNLIEEIVDTFLIILLTLIDKKPSLKQDSAFLYSINSLGIKKEENNILTHVSFKRRPLNAGFLHVALIRNGNVYTWGSSQHGSLGTGPTVLRFGSPQALYFFRSMQLEVLGLSCGFCHTLAVTNNGIYAWGGSQYGQLGLGKILQTSNPELITSLAQEVIIDAVAGQYHSVALTSDGRVFTWGWGVHGQLGHGNTDEKTTPTLVKSLLGIVIRHISAGYAHTLALSADGVVHAFGSNIFGQLGTGDTVKSSVPLKVSTLPERVVLITTAYFHNLAVGQSNKLYIWGASPQVLKMKAHAQKNRVLEQIDMDKKQREMEEAKKLEESSTIIADNNNFKETPKHAPNIYKNKYEGMSTKNAGMLEEVQTHLSPALIDTSLVKGQIVQISTGCQHNALLTRDGSLYTWGRNTDGQVGNGTKREVPIPTPLYNNPASIFIKVPPRHKKREVFEEVDESSSNFADTDYSASNDGERSEELDATKTEKTINPVIRSIHVCCGYDYTVAIQPVGTVLAWGNNYRAQLGRIPTKDPREGGEEKHAIIRSTRRIIRLPQGSSSSVEVPTQVPNIPAPIISYRSYDIPSLVGSNKPFSLIEKSPGELTLHYVLEQFNGIYDSTKIMDKSTELKNYQACSKLAALQNNVADAFCFQLKAIYTSRSISSECARNVQLNDASPSNADLVKKNNDLNPESTDMSQQMMKNTELFNQQVEKNLIESVEDSAYKIQMKISASKSLNSLQSLEQNLYSFDCQGGPEQLCRDSCDDTSMITEDLKIEDTDFEDSTNWDESIVTNFNPKLFPKDDSSNSSDSLNIESNKKSVKQTDNNENITNDNKNGSNAKKNNIMNEVVKMLKHYLNEVENDTDEVKCKILYSAIEFWLEHCLPIQSLENVFIEHIEAIYYSLGLILFCKNSETSSVDTNKNNEKTKNLKIVDVFSLKFCLKVCSMIMQYIEQGQLTPEYISLLSSMMADRYGLPLADYPGSSDNGSVDQVMKGVISALSSQDCEAKPFVHIKDAVEVNRLLSNEEDTFVFTCGHQFPISTFYKEALPKLEAELLMTRQLVLPSTAQYLEKLFSETNKPDIVCPTCIPNAIKNLLEKPDD
ncbi:uncharacterized protein ca [Prorops nasuta]|uniref:uncharacterized protein ca n=1 Tax=Prorops nasuta TaxID=863751 RepID=UPI0034CD986F